MAVAERVYNNREDPEEKQTRENDRQTQNLAKILIAATTSGPRERESQLRGILTEPIPGKDPRPSGRRLNSNQCAYCKEKGHWIRSCPKRRPQAPGAQILEIKKIDD